MPRIRPRRRPGVPRRRARHRGLGRCARARSRGTRLRDPAPLRAASGRGTGSRLPSRSRAAHHPGNQRGGDERHGPRHPLRGGHRHCARGAVVRTYAGPAPAGGAGLARIGGPAQGALWSRGPRCLHPALFRGRLPWPRAIHRAGTPAHQPGQRDPADEVAGARRSGGLPVPRHAESAAGGRGPRDADGSGRRGSPRCAHRARAPDGIASRGPARGTHRAGGGGRRRAGGGARHRCRTLHPGPARAAGRAGERRGLRADDLP